jgi:ATP synthase subunit 6
MFFSPLEQFDALILKFMFLHKYWIPVDNINFLYVLIYDGDVSITNILIPLFILNIFIIIVISFYRDEMKLVPDFWQYLLELLYNFILNIIEQQIGQKGYIYFPFIFSLFFFLLTCNLLSMTPFGIAFTSHILIILYLSLSIGISTFIIGLLTHNIKFLKIFIPECPFILLPFLIVIEMFSYIIRSFSLAIRLSANIMAGHTLVHIISTFLMNIFFIKFWFFFIFIFLILAVLLLELGVAFLQAYVFVILVCIYISDSLKSPGH